MLRNILVNRKDKCKEIEVDIDYIIDNKPKNDVVKSFFQAQADCINEKKNNYSKIDR
jgi:hypothetical protein